MASLMGRGYLRINSSDDDFADFQRHLLREMAEELDQDDADKMMSRESTEQPLESDPRLTVSWADELESTEKKQQDPTAGTPASMDFEEQDAPTRHRASLRLAAGTFEYESTSEREVHLPLLVVESVTIDCLPTPLTTTTEDDNQPVLEEEPLLRLGSSEWEAPEDVLVSTLEPDDRQEGTSVVGTVSEEKGTLSLVALIGAMLGAVLFVTCLIIGAAVLVKLLDHGRLASAEE